MYNVCGVNVHVDFWKIELYAYLVSSWAPIMSFLDFLTVQFYQSTKRLLQFIGVIPILLLRIIGEKKKKKKKLLEYRSFLKLALCMSMQFQESHSFQVVLFALCVNQPVIQLVAQAINLISFIEEFHTIAAVDLVWIFVSSIYLKVF